MTDAERYRRAGALYIYAAQQEAKEAARVLLVAMAEKWLSLAHQEEDGRGVDLSVPRT